MPIAWWDHSYAVPRGRSPRQDPDVAGMARAAAKVGWTYVGSPNEPPQWDVRLAVDVHALRPGEPALAIISVIEPSHLSIAAAGEPTSIAGPFGDMLRRLSDLLLDADGSSSPEEWRLEVEHLLGRLELVEVKRERAESALKALLAKGTEAEARLEQIARLYAVLELELAAPPGGPDVRAVRRLARSIQIFLRRLGDLLRPFATSDLVEAVRSAEEQAWMVELHSRQLPTTWRKTPST